MKQTILFISIFFFFSSMAAEYKSASKLNYKYFAQIPILSEGRIKPLDTYARTNLLLIFEKSALKEMSAIEWFAELIFDPSMAYSRKIFKIRNPDVVKALNLTLDISGNYDFVEVSTAINKEKVLVSEISRVPRNERSPTQKQIYKLYFKVSKVFELSRSLSLLIPQFQIPTKEYAEFLKLPFGKNLTYLQMQKRKKEFTALVSDIVETKNGDYSKVEQALVDMGRKLEYIASDNQTRDLRILPPQFDKTPEKAWHSPWQTVQLGYGSPLTAKFFDIWSELYNAYRYKDVDAWDKLSATAYDFSIQLSTGLVDSKKLKWEKRYNDFDFFTKAIGFYIFSFLLLSISWLVWKKKLEFISLASIGVGSIFHLIGLVLRCYIMDRPPVSTIYESVIFVSYISVICAFYMEVKHRNNLGTFIASTLGTILLFLSFSYEKDGDSMGMLAAVLDTNFWLATHVTTITIGYGCCFVASLLGHVYLFQKIIKDKFHIKQSFDMNLTIKNMHGAVLFALFFTVLGTILGGIWADQSWGRFWGWDPKENGALLICMWLLWIIHGRLTKYFGNVEYALTTALSSIIVVLAWFGVNLLSVGLHSYGFTDSIANNIAIFTIGELIVCFLAFAIIKFKANKSDIQRNL